MHDGVGQADETLRMSTSGEHAAGAMNVAGSGHRGDEGVG